MIDQFISRVNVNTDVIPDWRDFLNEKQEEDLRALIAEEELKDPDTRRFVHNAFRDGVMKTTGTELDNLLPPMSYFSKTVNRSERKKTIIDKLLRFFEKYFGLV